MQRRGRVSYRALKRQFDLDDAYLEDLKAELIRVYQLAVDQDGGPARVCFDTMDLQAAGALLEALA